MKLKKLLALALAGVLMLTLLTGCSGSGKGEESLVAEVIADTLKRTSPNIEVSYDVPELTSTIQPAFTPAWFQKGEQGNIYALNKIFPIKSGQTLDGFLQESLKAYAQRNFVSFYAFDSTGMSASAQAARLTSVASRTPAVTVYDKNVSPEANTKLRVGVCHKTVDGREYCLVVAVWD